MYDQIAPDYDRFNNWQNRLSAELPFIQRALEAQPKSVDVLDAACGTGMHALGLAKLGFKVSGADLSRSMIGQARTNAQIEGVDLRFEAAGFGNLASTFGAGSFDALLCLGNSLPHVTSQDELQETLADFSRCLRSGGKLLLQNRNFDAIMAFRQRWMEPQSFSDNWHEWLFTRFYDFESDGLIRFNMATFKRPLGGEWKASITSTKLMPQLRADMTQALTKAGFHSILSFGDMNGSVFDPPKSPNLVLLAFNN